MNYESSCEQAIQRRLMHRKDCHDKFIKKLEERKDQKNFYRQLYRQWQRQLVPDNRHLEIGNKPNNFPEKYSESINSNETPQK